MNIHARQSFLSGLVFSAFLASFVALLPASAGVTPPTRELGLAADLFTGAEKSLISKDAPKGSVIIFLSAKCPCSRSHEKMLTELATEYAPKGFHFTGILSNADEDESTARTHFTETKLPFPILRDRNTQIADRLGANRTPHAFLLSQTGEILFQGGVDDAKDASKAQRHYLREALERVAQGQLPALREVRSLGCKIQRP